MKDKSRHIYWRLLTVAGRYWLTFLGAFVCVAITSASSLILPMLVGFVFKVIEQKNMLQISYAALIAVGIYLVQGLATYGQMYLFHFIAQRVITDLRNRMFEHLQDLSLDFFSRWRSGEIISRFINDLNIIQNSLLNTLAEMTPRVVIFFGLVFYIFFLNWRLSLVALLTIPFFVFFLSRFTEQMQSASRQIQKKVADLASILQETLSGVRVVKSFTLEKEEIKKFTKVSEKNFFYSMKSSQVYATQGPVMTFFQILGTIVVVWYGGFEVVNGRLSTSSLISFLVAIGMLADPIIVLSKSLTLLAQAKVAAERVVEVIDIKTSVVELKNPRDPGKFFGGVSFKNVTFTYNPGAPPALSEINLNVSPGEVIALVGPSGSGKSTLVNLIPRFYDTTAGEVRVDDIPVKNLSLKFLRQQIGIVPQETVLFSGSVASNIAYGKMEATLDEIVAAAKSANAHEFIEQFPAGYETEVGEKGLLLSGGQRQRLAIARAILKNPHILILDEATSSLDSHSEMLIQEAIEKLMTGRTTFVIAHRLSTVQHASKILVLEQGRIIESGSHRELLDRGGLYRNLYERQFR